MGGAYELMMPMMLSMQKKMMEGMKESIKERPQASDSREAKPSVPKVDPEAAFKVFEEFMSAPSWYALFAYINGGLQLFFSALYILASVFLLLVKRGAATFFLWVAAISAIRNLVAAGIGLSAGSFFAFWSVASGAGGFLIDLVLIIVVAVSDRSTYRAAQTNVRAEQG
jgi:hypothetical protein